MTGRGYQRFNPNPAIEMRNINNGEAKVIRIYDYNTTKMLTFSFSTIMKINCQLYAKLMELRDNYLDICENTENKNFIDHEVSNYNAIIERLKKHPIWPYIEVKRSRAGTLERLNANKIEYVWRGGTTAVISDAALPIQMAMSSESGNDGAATYERLLYYEVELERVGIDKSINIGATLGKHFSYFTSSAQPGLRECSWGLSGDLGLLYDSNKKDVPYGPSFQDSQIIGCGFLLTTPEQFDKDDLDADKYTSNLFFCYDGLSLKKYPNQDGNLSLLPRNILHKLFAVTSTGSEGCKLKFNFGPRFKYEKANQMIANYFNLSKKRYLSERLTREEKEDGVDFDVQVEQKDKKSVLVTVNNMVSLKNLKLINIASDGAVGDHTNLEEKKLDLLTETEEEILSELVLQFDHQHDENNNGEKNKHIIDEGDHNTNNLSRDAYMKLKYEALYNKVIMSYYFYLKRFEELDSTTMYELLVHFHLLNLATIVSDVGISGAELIQFEQTVKEWVLSDDITQDKQQIASLILNTKRKHTDLLKEFRTVMLNLSDSLYNSRIVPISIKQMNAMSMNNIPLAIKQIAMGSNKYSQIYLLKLWRLISHQRRLNTKGSGKGDLTSLKQEFLLDFIAYFMSAGNTIELIEQLLISWSGGQDELERESSNFSGKYELSILLSGFIRGSNNPISAAIQIAQFIEENRRSFAEIEKELIVINDNVQKMAVDILEDIHSNRLAIIALEANSCLDIAIQYKLREFISSDRVQYLKQLMWTRSSNELLIDVTTEHFRNRSSEIGTWFHVIFDDYGGLFQQFFTQLFQQHTRKFFYEFFFTKQHQMSWFYSPIGKIQIEFFVYIIYLLLLIYVANSTTNVYKPDQDLNEIVFWICNISFVFAEIREATTDKKAYWSDGTNYIDIIINILYILLGFVRFVGWRELFTQCGNDKQIEECLDKPLNIIYIVLWFGLILFVCARISYMLFVFYNMGLLVRALFKMLADVANFVLLIILFLFGFALSMHLSTNGEVEIFNSVWVSCRTLFYAMLGEIDYGLLIEDTECQKEALLNDQTWKEFGCNNNMGQVRSVTSSLILFFWMLIAAILLINFIIAVMNNTYEVVQTDVDKFVKLNRLKVCRQKDRKLPTIPAPFQIIIVVLKWIWFYFIEPIIFIISGKFINEEKLICSFNHMKYFYKEEFWKKKISAPLLRKPFFIEYNDHIHGTPSKPPRGCCQRILFLRAAAAESRSGLLYVDSDHLTEKADPSIWTCGYCRCVNYEFEREKRRSTNYSDIIRYYKYNDLLPPEFGFSDIDIQFLEHIAPPLCDNCFRLRFWVKRHIVIESLLAFYLYFIISFLLLKLPLFLILFSITLIITLFGILISIFYGLYFCFRNCFKKCVNCCCKCFCCRKHSSKYDLKFKEQIERHRPLNKQRIIVSNKIISRLDQSLYSSDNTMGNYIGNEELVGELKLARDAEDQFTIKHRQIINNIGLYDDNNNDDDSDDDTNSYKTLNGTHKKYDLVLVMSSTDLNMEQQKNFIRLLHRADGLLSKELFNENIRNDFARKYHHRFSSIFYPKEVEDIVKREIITEGNQRIVLANDQYRKCIKFKKNISRLIEQELNNNNNKSNNNNNKLPQFEIKVMPRLISYNFGQ
eukprot:386671_1